MFWRKTEELLPNKGGLMLGRQKQRSRTSSVPPVCTPLPQHMSHYMCRLHICVPFSAGNLSRKGDLILRLISQSECNSAWFIINSHLFGIHTLTKHSLRRGKDCQSPCLCSFHLLPCGPSQRGERKNISTTPHPLFSSQSHWPVRWRPQNVLSSSKILMHSNRCCLLSTYYVSHFFK